MKKLTELDLQTALDECAEKKFKSHGAWLAGMVKRLNAVLISAGQEKPPKKLIIKTGNNAEPETTCVT